MLTYLRSVVVSFLGQSAHNHISIPNSFDFINFEVVYDGVEGQVKIIKQCDDLEDCCIGWVCTRLVTSNGVDVDESDVNPTISEK